VRGKGGAREKLDERGAGGLLRRGGVGEKQWGGPGPSATTRRQGRRGMGPQPHPPGEPRWLTRRPGYSAGF
jgi:hypothetical protein